MPASNVRPCVQLATDLKTAKSVFPTIADCFQLAIGVQTDKRSNVDIDLAGSDTPCHFDCAFVAARQTAIQTLESVTQI